MAANSLDGRLRDWDDVADEENWESVLIGNGLSINVWPDFGYTSLFDYAHGVGLTRKDLALFDQTPNFERVLGDLGTAIRVAEIVGIDAAPLYVRYGRIQQALGHAVRQVHPDRTAIPDATLSAIRAKLLRYEWIFTTSYDLLVYWAIGRGPGDTFPPFIDHFRYDGRCQFDPARASVYENETPVYFLHGALHLVVGGTGDTWKLTRTQLQTLLAQFGQPIADDPQARPLLVTEGSARDKLRSINANDYLSHALTTFSEIALPLVVFGSRLSEHDQHLVDAINENPKRPVAISLRPASRRDLATKQAEIFGRVTVDRLIFFDSTTHPLGAAELRAG